MVQGGRIRRKRQLVVAGLAAVLVTGVVAAGTVDRPSPRTEPPAMVEVGMRLPAPECSADPVTADATDVVIYLYDPSDQQVAALQQALKSDDRIVVVYFETRAQAYERVAARWKDSPEFVAAIDRDSLPFSFRLRLNDPARFADFSREYAAMGGVRNVIGRVCPASAPVGGVR